MKTKILSFALSLLFASTLFAQDKNLQITYPNGGIKYAHPLKKSKYLKPKIQTNFHHECISIPHGNASPEPAEQGYNKLKRPTHNDVCKITVYRGENFEGNNMAGGFNNKKHPADNYLAISNNGRIVSVDNYSIMEFDDTGTEISNTEWQYFFLDPTLTYNHFFDPKVIYDSYADRFILVVLYHNLDHSDSRVLVSFSNSIIGSNALTWNWYDFKAEDYFNNTSSNKYWFDYPNIAINKNELFVTLNIFNYPDEIFQKPFILQIDKGEGYNNMYDLPSLNYSEIFSGSGYAYCLLPLSDGLQSNNYQDVMYFVNNDSYDSSDMWWRKLTGNIQGNNQISTQHHFTSPIYYNIASYASQKGGNAGDRIKIYDNSVLSGFYKDSKLHFVFHSSDHGWMQIVYEIVDTNNNSVVAHTYGGFEDLTNYLYPSITCMNLDENSADRVIINYNKTSPDIYIQLSAIDFQNGKWGCNRVVKNSKDILDLVTYNNTSDTYERIGDYTSIQRKYNSNKAWLVGSYPFGVGPNNNGASKGLNAWISEVSLDGFWRNHSSDNYTMFPNPNNNTTELHFNFPNHNKLEQKNIIIKDITGIKVFEAKTKNNTIHLPYLRKGIYFIEIITKNHHYENHRLIIN